MLYLLDANVLIDANGKYYNLERVREFWEWLAHIGRESKVKIPVEIYEELRKLNRRGNPLHAERLTEVTPKGEVIV